MSLYTNALTKTKTQNEVFYFQIPSPDCTDVNIPLGVLTNSDTQCLYHSLFHSAIAERANFKSTPRPVIFTSRAVYYYRKHARF